MDARKRALRAERDRALSTAARAARSLEELQHLDRQTRPRSRFRRLLLRGVTIAAIAAPTFAVGYTVTNLGTRALSAAEEPTPALAALTAPPSVAPEGAAARGLDPRKVAHLFHDGCSSGEVGLVRQIDPQTWEVDRSFVEEMLESSSIMRTPRIIPVETDGRVVGVKIYGIRPGSHLAALGLLSGDLIRSVDGFEIGDPDAALRAYSRLRNQDHHVVEIERRGHIRYHAYEVIGC